MRMVFGLVLVVGLALAGFAVYMAQGFISQTQNALAEERAIREKSGPLVEVYVVNKALNYGDVLTKEDVQLIYWPENALPEKMAAFGISGQSGVARLFMTHPPLDERIAALRAGQ